MFVTDVEGDEAYISYESGADGTLDLQHTIVPSHSEGEGIGTALAKYAFEHAKSKQVKVIPSCPFIKAFVKQNEEYREHVVE